MTLEKKVISVNFQAAKARLVLSFAASEDQDKTAQNEKFYLGSLLSEKEIFPPNIKFEISFL